MQQQNRPHKAVHMPVLRKWRAQVQRAIDPPLRGEVQPIVDRKVAQVTNENHQGISVSDPDVSRGQESQKGKNA